jgi:threonyl-tRNA synthetase
MTEDVMDSDDHKAIGNRLDLFHQQDDAPGMVFWHPRGATLYRLLERYMSEHMRRAGFREVRTPQLLARSLWERSGHLEKFGDSMFLLDDGDRTFALKPMSCPGHVQIFNKRVRSYRDLPLRFCELGACHRNEPSGALSGLMRARAFTQDDAHIFCCVDQIEEEVGRFCDLLRVVYTDFGFPDFSVGFSTRPAARAGSDAVWDQAESALAAAARASGLDYGHQPGEGAFYGPKLEFRLRDSHGRRWQCGTIQLDFVMPDRLDAEYIDTGGQRVRPVMIHHAVLGSLERFAAILLEHYQGNLPFWLAPEQIVVAPVSKGQVDYARRVATELESRDLRVVLDERSESLSRRIVYAKQSGIPVFVVVGRREEAESTVTVRRRSGDPVTMALADAIRYFESERHA